MQPSLGSTRARSKRVNGVMGVGVAFALFGIVGAAAVSCQPGSLPCNINDQACRDSILGKDGGTAGGAGGQAPGGAGGNAGKGGTGGAEPPPTIDEDTEVDCAGYPTLGEMDKFFQMRCGVDSQCHNGDTWTNFKMPKVWERMLDTAPKFTCKKDKMIDGADWQKSVILLKGKASGVPKCPTGTGGGSMMPPPNNMQMAKALTADEVKCIESFVKAAATGEK